MENHKPGCEQVVSSSSLSNPSKIVMHVLKSSIHNVDTVASGADQYYSTYSKL